MCSTIQPGLFSQNVEILTVNENVEFEVNEKQISRSVVSLSLTVFHVLITSLSF